MQQTRRSVLKAGGVLGLAAVLGGALLKPGRALAAWNQGAFEAKSALDAMKALGMQNAEESKDIVIRAPDIAENGAVVPIDVTSNISGTSSISVFIE
jgi:sulfur-oxidizing protein SoxY